MSEKKDEKQITFMDDKSIEEKKQAGVQATLSTQPESTPAEKKEEKPTGPPEEKKEAEIIRSAKEPGKPEIIIGVKVRVSKGYSHAISDDQWMKIGYEIEVQVPTEEDIQGAKDMLEYTIDQWLPPPKPIATPTPTPAPKPSGQPAKPTATMDKVTSAFPKDLAGMLYFEDAGDYIAIKPRQYLGSEIFIKVANIVKDQLQGEYMSLGKNSYFRVFKEGRPPEEEPPMPPDLNLDPDQLEDLEWTKYKSKDKARPGEAGWIFSNKEGAEVLYQVIDDHGGKDVPVTMGQNKVFLCSFSGEDKKFIGRRPQK